MPLESKSWDVKNENEACKLFAKFLKDNGLWPVQRHINPFNKKPAPLVDHVTLVSDPSWGKKVQLKLNGPHFTGGRSVDELMSVFASHLRGTKYVFVLPRKSTATSTLKATGSSESTCTRLTPQNIVALPKKRF